MNTELSNKSAILERLLKDGHITVSELVVLAGEQPPVIVNNPQLLPNKPISPYYTTSGGQWGHSENY